MDQGNPNPQKYFLCNTLSPQSEFNTFSEALTYVSSNAFDNQIMIIQHRNLLYIYKRDCKNNVSLSTISI